ncbi:hypothetical protein FRC19_011239 [Serendipita sp. 401]|nr:hypothetical protein FRC19_011239 [Serendipita sp. 401]
MPPKKQQQKMSLNEFLGDANFGSWADEMEDFPTAPAPRADEQRGSALSRAMDRGDRSFSTREELPLPTQPPYTAFVGNLTFDITERELGDHFRPSEVKTVKIIKDREDKPKGFGYVEFVTLDGLKSALEKSNSTLAGRTIRVSVADPPKEREGRSFGDRGGSSGTFDDDRQWRREGPLPSHDDKRGGFGGGGRSSNRFGDSNDGDRDRDRGDRGERMGFGSKSQAPPPSIAEETTDWRSTMKAPAPPPQQQHHEKSSRFGFGDRFSGEGNKRRGSGVSTGGHESPKVGPADLEEKWSIGSRLKPSQSSPERQQEASGTHGRKFGAGKPEPDTSEEVQDWRSTPRKTTTGPPPTVGSGRGSGPERTPSTSGPPTRRKLELLPRTNAELTTPGSPRSAEVTPASATSTKPNPFGAAKPVDAAAREREITEKMERARLASTPLQGTTSLGSRPSSRPTSRTGSRAGSPTRSPRTTGLGLGGMTNTPATPTTPKILTRPMGTGPPNRSGNHGRTPSFNTRGGESAGEWRRNMPPSSASTTSPGPSTTESPTPAPISTASERRASIVRPTLSFASAAGGSKVATSTTTKGNSAGNPNEPTSVES